MCLVNSLGSSTLYLLPSIVMPLKMAWVAESLSGKKILTKCVLIPVDAIILMIFMNLIPCSLSSSANSVSVISGSTPLITAFHSYSLAVYGTGFLVWQISYLALGPKFMGFIVLMNLLASCLLSKISVLILVLCP